MTVQQLPTVALDAARSITLNAAKHVELCWGVHQIEMRMADLIVLHKALEDWQNSAEWTPAVTVWLNDFPLHFSIHHFDAFCSLVSEMFAVLPRQVVRWADLNVRIDSYRVGQQNGLSQFSRN